MTKWADYVITQASFNKKNKIENLKLREDNGQTLGVEEIVTRDKVIHDISKGRSYVTAYNGLSGMKKGKKISVLNVENEFYLRIDKNKAGFDYLGPVAEIS